MKYCVLSDAHANYPALKSVVDTVDSTVDGFIYLGDIVGLLGFPSETVSLLQDISLHTLKGNHDIKTIEDNMGWVNDEELSEFERSITQNLLSESQKTWISDLQSFQQVTEGGVDITLSHGLPTPEKAHGVHEPGLMKKNFVTYASKIDTDFILVGHTHSQEALDCSQFGHNTTVLNPGTVGQNFSSDEGYAEYAIIDTEKNTYSLKSQEYTVQDVIDRLNELDVPVKWWR